MTDGIWPAVLGRFTWTALPFVRAWETPTISEIIGAGAASIVILGAILLRHLAHRLPRLATALVGLADQPRSQEDRDHVCRARLCDARPRADRGGADADAAGERDRHARLHRARPFRAAVQHARQRS